MAVMHGGMCTCVFRVLVRVTLGPTIAFIVLFFIDNTPVFSPSIFSLSPPVCLMCLFQVSSRGFLLRLKPL